MALTRISKKQWESLGGLRNSDLANRMVGGRWTYWKGATK